jgi:outer membrane lipoprotein-sorting protein
MFQRTLTGLALAALLAAPAAAQTVDELIAKNIQAKGGMEKLKSVKSVRATGKMMVGHGDQVMEAPFTMMFRRPKQFRIEFIFGGMTGIQAYDGKNAWMVMPFMGKKDPEAMPAEETRMADEQSDLDGHLVDWKEKGHKVELVGKEQVEGADAYKLKVTLKSGDVSYVYLDAESHLEMKSEAKRHIRGSEVESETLFGDYKEVEGLMVAHTVDSGAKGIPQRQKRVVEKIEVNVALADSLFAMPAGTKPAAIDTSKVSATPGAESTKVGAEAKTTTTKKATASAKAAATEKPKTTKP